MSKQNRLKVYNKLLAACQLKRDDGSLEKEFGKAPTQVEPKPKNKPKKGK